MWLNSLVSLLIQLGIMLILVLGFYSGLSGRVRRVYPFSLRTVSLLSSRFTDSVLAWCCNFLKYMVLHPLFH
jgi:hypothetical protein